MHKTLRNTISDCIIDGLQRPEGKGGWATAFVQLQICWLLCKCVFFSFHCSVFVQKVVVFLGKLSVVSFRIGVFFSSHLFSRRGSGWSCLTGQLPGMYHLYTGGSGCGRKQGQVQATAPLTRPGRQP